MDIAEHDEHPKDDIKQDFPEYTETLETQLSSFKQKLIGWLQWEWIPRRDLYEVRLDTDHLKSMVIDLAQGSHTGIWLKELIAGCFPEATPMIDANAHLGICHPEQAYIGVPAIIVASLKNYVEHGQQTGSFLRLCLENDFVKAGMKADNINGIALPQIAKYIFHELPPDSFGTIETVDYWLVMSDEDRKELLKLWREPEQKVVDQRFEMSQSVKDATQNPIDEDGGVPTHHMIDDGPHGVDLMGPGPE